MPAYASSIPDRFNNRCIAPVWNRWRMFPGIGYLLNWAYILCDRNGGAFGLLFRIRFRSLMSKDSEGTGRSIFNASMEVTVRKTVMIVIVLVAVLLVTSSCKSFLQTYVRFDNRSASKTVAPVWDGVKLAALAPGETSSYKEVNPGNHTIKWVMASTNKDLTSLAWPNIVAGQSLTFPYTD